MRPLDRFSSIKMKLGAVIVAAVAVTVAIVAIGVEAEIPIWILALVAGAASLAMIHFLARGMTSPLREMVDAAQAMARGDHDRRVTATSRDEVGELARAFNKMTAELGEVERIRKDLIANVSHELRTPISALQAVLENLVDGVEETDPRILETMLAQVERLGHLVAQLLELSRLESGAETLHVETIELRSLLEQNLREAELAGHEVRLELEITPPDLRIEADPVKIHQVVANLIDNATRHSPKDGVVRVVASDLDGVTIEVIDQGPGIPEGERQKVFDRFVRLDESRPGPGGSSGLGLSIARWIVELHGGDIRAAAGGSSGCRMVVTLPSAG